VTGRSRKSARPLPGRSWESSKSHAGCSTSRTTGTACCSFWIMRWKKSSCVLRTARWSWWRPHLKGCWKRSWIGRHRRTSRSGWTRRKGEEGSYPRVVDFSRRKRRGRDRRMGLSAEFNRELRKLFYRRIAWLRVSIGRKHAGRAARFSKDRVRPVLKSLGDKARGILLKKRGRKEFSSSIGSKRQWHVRNSKGWGRRAKKTAFRSWYQREIHS